MKIRDHAISVEKLQQQVQESEQEVSLYQYQYEATKKQLESEIQKQAQRSQSEVSKTYAELGPQVDILCANLDKSRDELTAVHLILSTYQIQVMRAKDDRTSACPRQASSRGCQRAR